MTFLMLLAVIAFVFIMRGRTKHRDDYRYEVAESFMLSILWILIAISQWKDSGFPWTILYVVIIVLAAFRGCSILYNHKKNAK